MTIVFHQVLVIFSDGLDEDVISLENESERLRQSGNTLTRIDAGVATVTCIALQAGNLCVRLPAGISALLVVALQGVRNATQLQMVEFGRGFGYKLPLTIGMPSVGSAVLKQIVSRFCFSKLAPIVQTSSFRFPLIL